MKRMSNILAAALFALAALLAVTAGANLHALRDLSGSIIAEAFPISYTVRSTGSVTLDINDASVVFKGDTAVIESDAFAGSVPVDSAIFTCNDKAALSQNNLRSGLLFILMASGCFALSAALILGGFAINVKAAEQARAAVLRRTAAVSGGGQRYRGAPCAYRAA